MQKLSEQEMATLLQLIKRADSDQLRVVIDTVRSISDIRHRQATIGLTIGTRVKWNGKNGPMTGVIKQVKMKYVLVTADGGLNLNWNVPAAMLTVIP